MPSLSKARIYAIGALVVGILLGFLPADIYRRHVITQERSAFLEKYRGLDQSIIVERNKSKSLNKVLREAYSDNEELLTLIAELKDRPERIRTIVKTVTVVGGQTEVVEIMPDAHLFRTEQGLPVASMEVDDQITFRTYDLRFDSSYVIADRYTSYKLKVSSSYDPEEWYELSSELEVIDIRERKHRFFSPKIGMVASLNVPSLEPGLGIYFSALHPTPDVDILSLRLQPFTTPRLGVDAVGYRLGKHLPFFDDLWLFGGASISIHGDWSGDLSIGTRL